MERQSSRFLIFLVMCDVITSASSVFTFENEPPLTRRYLGDDLTMQWTLNSDPEDYSRSTFFNEDNVRIMSHTHGRGDTPGPGCKGRLSFYSTSSRGVGFRLTDVTLSDAGRYRCRYEPPTEPSIESSSTVFFTFGEPSTPVISLKRYGQIGVPFTGDLEEGVSVTLLCEASSSSLPAADRPAMTYTWTRDGEPIDRDDPPGRHSVPNVTGRRLDINPVNRTDVTYSCTAREEGSNLDSQTTRNLTVLYPPGAATVTVPPPSHVVQGIYLMDICFLPDPGNPRARVVYRSPKGQFPTTTNNMLVISDVTLERDDGTWECYGESSAGTGSKATFDVTVYVPPTVTLTISPQGGSQGDRVEIVCDVDSTPLSQVTWTNVTSSGVPRGTVIAGQRQHTLTLDPADCLDSGTIRCTADNVVTPAASDQRELSVFCPPRLDLSRPMTVRQAVYLGKSAKFLLYVIANPAPVSWTYSLTAEDRSFQDNNVNGVTLSSSDNHGNLTIASVQPHHYGDYGIRVTNDRGQPLRVKLQLQRPGSPESPDGFRVRNVTCASVRLQWSAGFNGGSPQTFHLSYRRYGAAEWRTDTVEDSGQDIITHKVQNDIVEHTSYDIKLFAQNDDGRSEENMLTFETTACPGLVADSLVISIEDNIATIAWQFTQRVDRVDVKCCTDPGVCTKQRVDQPTAREPIAMEVPSGSQRYLFTFTLYQDGDVVTVSETTFDTAPQDNNAATIGAVTATVILVIIVIVVVIVVIVLRRKRRVSKRDATPLYENTEHHDRSPTDLVEQTPTEEATELEKSQVEIQNMLSDGIGFQVYSAQVQIGLSLHAAVVKKVKEAASNEVYSSYLTDQKSVLLKLKHVNIVTIIGFQTDSGGEYENAASMSSVSLVLEPATQGDLHTFLTGHGSGVYQKTVSTETMMGMALGVATGALALSKFKPEVLHYCLCAKHVLLDGRGVCKLTGFSTAVAVRAREAWEAIHKAERPIRWMSAETLDHLEHTTKSDVWSFAVFLWELFSLGETPYPGMDDTEVQETVQEGRRLDKPNNCDPATYDLMIECWMRNTDRRPGFQYVAKCLMKSLSEKARDSARHPSGEHTYEAIV